MIPEPPPGLNFIGERGGIENVGVSETPMQQARKPAPHQSDVDAAGDADLGGESLGDTHQHGADDAAEKRPD